MPYNMIFSKNIYTKGHESHEYYNTRYYAVKSYRNRIFSVYVCGKYHIHKSLLFRWNRRLDRTKEVLLDISNRLYTQHPTIVLKKSDFIHRINIKNKYKYKPNFFVCII